MRVSLAELLDRKSIVTLKFERSEAIKPEFQLELDAINNAIREYMDERIIIKQEWFDGLYNINGQIWDWEADIRNGKEGLLGLEEVGRRAIKIRDFNSERIAIKNKITSETSTGFKEIKINHASGK